MRPGEPTTRARFMLVSYLVSVRVQAVKPTVFLPALRNELAEEGGVETGPLAHGVPATMTPTSRSGHCTA